MVILKLNDKEFKLVPRTRKVVDLTDKLKSKNLNDLIFGALNETNIKVLAELIYSFAEFDDGKQVFSSVELVYDFIDEWKQENDKGYVDLFKEVIEVVNEMGFFTKKMTQEELEKEMDNPMPIFNLQELAMNSAQKMMDEIAQEEFKGYKG